MTPAGSAWPGGVDPGDANLRIAPTYPKLEDVQVAAEAICTCVLVAASRPTLNICGPASHSR